MPTDHYLCRELHQEYTSVFTAALRPEVRFEKLKWERVVGFLDYSSKADTVFRLLKYFAERFRSQPRLYFPPQLEVAEGTRDNVAIQPLKNWTPDGVLSAISLMDADVAVLPAPFVEHYDPDRDLSHEQDTLGSTLDVIVRNATVPVLLVEPMLYDCTKLGSDILLLVPENLDMVPALSAAFSLVEPNGTVLMYHVIDTNTLERYRRVVERTSWIDSARGAEALERGVRNEVERMLESVEEKIPFNGPSVSSQITFGDPTEQIMRRISGGEFSLVVAMATRDRNDSLGMLAYNLSRLVTNVPVLVI